MKLPFWPDPKGYRDIDLGLKRVYDLLERLNNPHQKLPPTIHFAGTNGKGSTLSFLREIFVESGYLVHTYTSPHLISFNERIILANKQIDDKFLNECLQACKDAASQHPKIEVTFFEGITVAAFLAFSKIKADILLLETGMGGRLDATNVIAKNLLTIITPISLDHTDFLGKTLAKIAVEKAGIIKKGSTLIIGRQNPSALKAIEAQALKVGSLAVKAFGRDFVAKKNRDNKSWIYQNNIASDKAMQSIDFSMPSLSGQHQLDNAATAITAALTQKKLPIKIAQIKTALQKTIWPARLQKIIDGKFANILPDNFELILDGSHNLQGAATIQKFLKSQKYKKKFVIFAMLQDKNCEDFLDKIKYEIDELICLTIPDESKAIDKKQILKIAKNLKINSQTADNFDDAFKKIISKKNKDKALILICGSLYLAGEFLKENK